MVNICLIKPAVVVLENIFCCLRHNIIHVPEKHVQISPRNQFRFDRYHLLPNCHICLGAFRELCIVFGFSHEAKKHFQSYFQPQSDYS